MALEYSSNPEGHFTTPLTRVGLPLLIPLPWPQTFAIFAYAMVSCLVVNDAVKLGMIN
jgi:hypothetical protein